tara:strand:+ start:470 stop:3118 length:2649 start_codon:yes stop_codon:yes gene_type:complete
MQTRQWARHAEEHADDREALLREAEHKRIDMREYHERELKDTHQPTDAQREFYDRVTRDLDEERPYSQNVTTWRMSEDAGDDDDDAANDVDVLDATAPMGAGDKVPDRVAIFQEEDDGNECIEGIADADDVPTHVINARSYDGFRVPVDMLAALKSHQQDALFMLLDRAAANSGAILALAPGLGKTVTALSFLACRKSYRKSCRSIVVCPKSLILQWASEIDKFNHFLHLQAFVMDDPSTLQHVRAQWEKSDGGVLIIGTYRFGMQFQNRNVDSTGSCKRAVGKRSKLTHCELAIDADTVVVVDEAHQELQTGTAHLYHAMAGLNTQRRVLLTGTPMQHSLCKYYTMVKLAAPDLLPGTHMNFDDEYGKAILAGAQKEAGEMEQYQAKLKLGMLTKVLAPAIAYASSDTFLAQTLPPKIETLIIHPIDDGAVLSADGNHFARSKEVCLATLNTKLAILKLLCEQFDPADRVLVFSEYLDTLNHMMVGMNNKSALLTGQIKALQARESILKFFRETPGAILFISLGIGACGLNLSCANRVVILDVSWNPMLENQAVARAYRIGQTKRVYVYRLCAFGTIEERKYVLGVQKSRLAMSIVDDKDVSRVYDAADLYAGSHYSSNHDGDRIVDTDDKIATMMKRHDQTIDVLKEDEDEYTIIRRLCDHSDAQFLYVATHDDNVRVGASETNMIQNQVNNELNRQDAFAGTRKLDGVEDPVSTDTIFAPDGGFVPPMAIAWLDTVTTRKDGATTGSGCVNFDTHALAHLGKVYGTFAPSKVAYAAVDGLELQVKRLEMNRDQIDPTTYDEGDWEMVAQLSVATDGDCKGSIRDMTEFRYMSTEGKYRYVRKTQGVSSYKTRIFDTTTGKTGPWSAPSAALVIAQTPAE